MPNLTYLSLPKKINRKGLIPIVANVTVNGKNTWKTMMWIKEDDWDPKPEKEKWIKPGRTGSKDYIENKRKNELLKTYKDRIDEYFEQCTLDNVKVTPQLVKAYFNGVNPEDVSANNFWDAYKEFFKNRPDMKANTLRGDKTTHNLLKLFEKETGYYMTFDSVNQVFYDNLKTWMCNKQKGSNYFAANIKRLKTYMKWTKGKYHNNTAYQDINFSAREVRGTIVFLTLNELQKLYNFQFEDPKYSRARDIFCFGCFTGLRHSDLYSLTREHIEGDYIVKYAAKTIGKEEAPLRIPLLPQAKTIIERYSATYRALPKLSQQKLNDYIKDAAKIVGISTPVKYKDFTGGQTTEKIAPKHELISSHTGRKTFITLAFKQKMSIEVIKKITGIKQEKTLLRYLHIDDDTALEALNDAFKDI